jgi:hypothetical protein
LVCQELFLSATSIGPNEFLRHGGGRSRFLAITRHGKGIWGDLLQFYGVIEFCCALSGWAA